MKYIVLVIFCEIFICTICKGQSDSLKVAKDPGFQYGVSIFPRNYKGLDALMNQLQASQDTMYSVMSERFNQLKQRRNSGKILGYTGAGIGVSLMVGTAISTRENKVENSNNATGYVAGGIMIGVGALLYHLFNVSENDVIDFVNDFNKKSEDRKLKLVIGTSAYPDQMNPQGLSLIFNF